RQGFQRLYDLPERVIPDRHLGAQVPSEDAFRRSYALRAVAGRGALTAGGIAEHCRFEGGARGAAPYLDGLPAAGPLRRLADRRRRVLDIKRFTPEPGVRRRLDGPLERAASRLARTLGLEVG